MHVLKCPVHKFNMEVRIAKEGKYKGQKFYVCPMWPDCKMSVKYDEYLEKVLHLKPTSTSEDKDISPQNELLFEEIKKRTQDSLKYRETEPRNLYSPSRRRRH